MDDRKMKLASRSRLAIVLLFAATACTPAVLATPSPSPAPAAVRAGAMAWVREELYFGRRIGTERLVTDEEWSAFVDSVVTPRFPDGLTVIEANGHWRGENGVLVREPSKLLILFHPGRPEQDRAIREIIDYYKRRFTQDAVLRVTTTVSAEL